jgi:hypothetical protein
MIDSRNRPVRGRGISGLSGINVSTIQKATGQNTKWQNSFHHFTILLNNTNRLSNMDSEKPECWNPF